MILCSELKLTHGACATDAAEQLGTYPGCIGSIKVTARSLNSKVINTKLCSRDSTRLMGEDGSHLLAANQSNEEFIADGHEFARPNRELMEH